MKRIVMLIVLLGGYCFAQTGTDDESKGVISINSPFSYRMLEPMEDLRKVKIFMEEREKGTLSKPGLIFGASLIGIMDFQSSNTDSKFGYLMRHPTANNQIGTTVTEASLHSFQVGMAGTVNSWLGLFAEVLYNPEQSFGTGTITDLNRNQLQLRKGFIAVGNPEKFPVYGAIGKMDGPFGQMGTVSPFTNSTPWHAFATLGYGAQVSFRKFGIHATVMAVQGGAQFRALNTNTGAAGDTSNVPSIINNFIGDLNYTLELGDGATKITAGGSYVHGSAYCHTFPVQHFFPCPGENPAFTAYGRVSLMDDKLIVKGSYSSTFDIWPGTHNPIPPLDVWEASKVTSLDAGARFNFQNAGPIKWGASAEFSNFIAGPDGSPWERQNQYVLGFFGMVRQSSKIFVELFRTEGYVPLNFISGGNLAPGTTHSVNGASSLGIVVGGQLTL